MPKLDLKKLQSYRVRTYRLPPSPRVASPKAALDFELLAVGARHTAMTATAAAVADKRGRGFRR